MVAARDGTRRASHGDDTTSITEEQRWVDSGVVGIETRVARYKYHRELRDGAQYTTVDEWEDLYKCCRCVNAGLEHVRRCTA